MKGVKKIISFISIFCVLINSVNFLAFAVSEGNEVSANEFLKMSGELVETYDTPFFIPESNTVVEFEDSNRIIVKTQTNDTLPDDQGAIDKVEGWNSIHILQYSSEDEVQNALDFYLTQPYVKYAEKDHYVQIIPESTEEKYVLREPLSWGNDVVGTTKVNECLLNSNMYLPEIKVAVIDTGLDIDHPYFTEDRILEGYNAYMQNNNVSGNAIHGTHVTGIIYNNTLSNVKIKMFKLTSNNYIAIGSPVSLIATTLYSIVDEGFDVVNISASLDIESYYIDEALENLYRNNISVIVSAGNDTEGEGQNADDDYLASKECVISVSAIDENLTPALKSKNGEGSTNYGKTVDIAAPGENITSLMSGKGYLVMSGTSMAAPFVTAAVAIIKSIKPNITSKEVLDLIKSSATVPSDWNDLYGAGILNVENMASNYFSVSPKISFDDNRRINITASSSTSVIYYTTDGSTPIVGESAVYTEPLNPSNINTVNAITYEKGKLPSSVSIFKVKWTENHTILYKGRYKLKMPSKIVKFTNSNEEVISFDGERITGNTIGEARLTLYLESGQTVTCNVTVEFADWQIIHKIFYKLFGVLLWCFEFNC